MSRLRELRFFKRMTQYRLAALSQVHQSRISLFENGWAEPRPDERDRLARALRIKPEEIFTPEEIGLQR